MHFMPDTEDIDSAAETFWPEGYKQVIRDDVRQLVAAQLGDGKKLRHVYQQQYSEKYACLNQFINRIADMIVVGAENGSDAAFDDVITAFLTEFPLPQVRRYARYLWPQVFSQRTKGRLHQVITDEYSQDNVYTYAYKVGYQRSYHSFGEFITQVAEVVVTGAINGTDDMLAAIYLSFISRRPLPPARRHPRRLKMWLVPSREA